MDIQQLISPYGGLNTAGLSFLLILILLLLIIKKPTSRSKRREPPEVSGGWPIIGHLPLFQHATKLPHETLGAMADTYGPIFRIRIGTARPTLIISSSELFKHCHTTLDSIVSSRPKGLGGKLLGYNFAAFGFRDYDSFYRSMRKMVVSQVLSNRSLELKSEFRVCEVKKQLLELYHLCINTHHYSSNQVVVDMEEWIGNINLKVVVMLVCGKRFAGGCVDDEEMRRCRKIMRDFLDLMGKFVVGDSIPFLRFLDLGGYEKAMNIVSKQMDSLLEEWLDQHRRNTNSAATATATTADPDLMDVMLSNLQGMDLAGYDADTVIKATCTSIITGASDTVTVTLAWAISLLLNNREALRRAQEELDIHVGKERLVNESDITKLVYLEAVVSETLRLYPPGPLSGVRVFTQDCTVGGYDVPAGTQLITNLWKIQTNPEVWEEALEFKPERFLLDVKGQNFEFAPFGCGRRGCPGMSLGLQMTKLVLASVVHSFELETACNEAVDMAAKFGLTMYRANPLQVMVKPRLVASAYASA